MTGRLCGLLVAYSRATVSRKVLPFGAGSTGRFVILCIFRLPPHITLVQGYEAVASQARLPSLTCSRPPSDVTLNELRRRRLL